MLTISIGVIIYYAYLRVSPEIAFKLQEEPVVPVTASVGETRSILVHVAGAVKNPGVYSLKEGERVKDAIEAAGGHMVDADILRLNLAQKLYDEDKLYVPKIGETPEDLEGTGLSGGSIVGLTSKDDGKVDINTASEAELTELPGVGPVTAQKIVDYRNTNGKFDIIDDIKNVSGIGDKKFEQIREKIKVR